MCWEEISLEEIKDDFKKSMSGKIINSLSLGRRGDTHLVSLPDNDSGHNSVTSHKVIIVVIHHSPLKYLIRFHYRLFMHNIVM